MSTKRIAKEYAEISQTPPDGFSVSLPPSDSLHSWHVTLAPPAESIYHPGKFGILLTLPTDYPFRAPTVKFITRIYHPNVTNDETGSVCLALLKSENWKPSTKIAAVLDAMRNLLVEPAPDDPLDDAIAEQYRNDRAAFDAAAKAAVQKYASQDPVFPTQ
ncbi:hypothetical protein Golomagni_07459 [Golovinomyces magnicellulatus]|nr:hypothetical protein Golomagni_07459 [Golovinomyces magnicellulatus]